jgi:hypothetical protein
MIVCVLVENGPYFYNSFLIECFSYIVENGHPTKQYLSAVVCNSDPRNLPQTNKFTHEGRLFHFSCLLFSSIQLFSLIHHGCQQIAINYYVRTYV